MAELDPRLAKAKAQTALQFLSAFDGEDFGFMREDNPGPHDRRHLAIALDHIQELGAMVLNLADRVPLKVGAGGTAKVERDIDIDDGA
jgi:hypothetical protein